MLEIVFLRDVTDSNVHNLIERILKEGGLGGVRLYICSPGGALAPAISFYEFVRARNVDLEAIAIGEVSSAALFLFLAGKKEKRKATRSAFFLLHKRRVRILKEFLNKLWFSLADRARYNEDREYIERIEQKAIEILKKETNLDPEEIEKAFKESYRFFDVQQALQLGIVSEIIGGEK